jgi:hypothetical protein
MSQKTFSAFSSVDNDSMAERPKMVSKSTFIAATETLYGDIAKAQGGEYANTDDGNTGYAIGRLVIHLSIPLEIELVEIPGELVLVNGASVGAEEQGIKLLDTIVAFSSGTFKGETLALNIEETVAIMQTAIQHARDNGEQVITLELNRLVKGFYQM